MSSVVDLASTPPNSRVVVVDICAGHGLKMRLLQIGLIPGTEVEVLENRGGMVMIRFRGTVLTLSRGIAKKIIVSPRMG